MTLMLNVKVLAAQHELLGEAPPFSAELSQMLATLGALLRVQRMALVSRRTTAALEVHMEWTAAAPAAGCPEGCGSAVETPPLSGQRRCLKATLEARNGREWQLLAERSSAAEPFTPLEENCASLMFDLFRGAFAVWRRLQTRTHRLAAMEALANTVTHGVILVNANTNIVFANRRAETLLAESAGLVRSHARLTAAVFDDAVRLQAGLHYALRQRDDDSGLDDTAAPLITIRRAGAPNLYVAIVRVSMHDPGAGALAALYIVDPAVDLSDAAGHTCQLHGLTQAETRLAKHLVAGLSLGAAAASMKIQEHTARAYLKQIFSKMDISRQAELVRLLMASIVPLRTRFISVLPHA